MLTQSSGPNMWIAMKNILKQIKVHQYRLSHVAKQQEKPEPTKELASMLCHLEKNKPSQCYAERADGVLFTAPESSGKRGGAGGTNFRCLGLKSPLLCGEDHGEVCLSHVYASKEQP